MAEYRLILIEDDPGPPPAVFDERDLAVISMYDCESCEANWPIKCVDHVIETW